MSYFTVGENSIVHAPLMNNTPLNAAIYLAVVIISQVAFVVCSVAGWLENDYLGILIAIATFVLYLLVRYTSLAMVKRKRIRFTKRSMNRDPVICLATMDFVKDYHHLLPDGTFHVFDETFIDHPRSTMFIPEDCFFFEFASPEDRVIFELSR